MKFKVKLALKNIKARPGRSALLIIIVAFLAASVFGGSTFIGSVIEGIFNYQVRLGADMVVIPEEVDERGSYEGILLQGIPDTFYMDASVLEKIREIEGVEQASAQFFLASAAASCCDSPVQIIGFDPKTDFSIQPWIRSTTTGLGRICLCSASTSGVCEEGSHATATSAQRIQPAGPFYRAVHRIQPQPAH